MWVKFSDMIFGDGVKYDDYLSSINLDLYTPIYVKETIDPDKLVKLVKENTVLPNHENLNQMQQEILDNCPFNLNN